VRPVAEAILGALDADDPDIRCAAVRLVPFAAALPLVGPPSALRFPPHHLRIWDAPLVSYPRNPNPRSRWGMCRGDGRGSEDA